MAFTVGAKLNVPQVENACHDPKQVLRRITSCKTKLFAKGEWLKSECQHPTYSSVNLMDVDDLQSIFDCFPVVLVINGRHDGTLSLSETAGNSLSSFTTVSQIYFIKTGSQQSSTYLG